MCLPSEDASVIQEAIKSTQTTMVVTVLLGLVLLLIASAAVLYGTHRGYKRSMDFWYHVGPLIAEWKLLKARRKYLFHSRKDDDEWYELMTSYHQKTAPKVVNVIMKLGGIYVKIGQFLAAVGGGVMDDSYVTALQPLQEGMPPQPISEISGIIESSLGRPLDDLFSEFDETPIGAASIAQAHGAVWRKDGSSVIVKVQYPFVADLYEADFHNLELATKFINPDNVPTIDTLKERHRKELDFNLEAHNLAEVSANMQRHGLEPRVIRIPRVIETSKNVLVMEYLKGKSLAEAMEEEHDQIAKSLGMANSTELRKTVIKNLRDHFKGGGGGHDLVTGAATQAAPLVRMYAGIAKTIRNFGRRVHNVVDKTIEIVSGGNHEAHLLQLEETIGVNLKQVLKTLVHVHGIQVMLDGVYNADPRKCIFFSIASQHFNELTPTFRSRERDNYAEWTDWFN